MRTPGDNTTHQAAGRGCPQTGLIGSDRLATSIPSLLLSIHWSRHPGRSHAAGILSLWSQKRKRNELIVGRLALDVIDYEDPHWMLFLYELQTSLLLEQKDGHDVLDLPCGTATALIGDPGTNKSALGTAFLCRAFFDFATELRIAIGQIPDPNVAQANVAELASNVRDRFREKKRCSGSILVTTYDIDKEQLICRFKDHLEDHLLAELKKDPRHLKLLKQSGMPSSVTRSRTPNSVTTVRACRGDGSASRLAAEEGGSVSEGHQHRPGDSPTEFERRFSATNRQRRGWRGAGVRPGWQGRGDNRGPRQNRRMARDEVLSRRKAAVKRNPTAMRTQA